MSTEKTKAGRIPHRLRKVRQKAAREGARLTSRQVTAALVRTIAERRPGLVGFGRRVGYVEGFPQDARACCRCHVLSRLPHRPCRSSLPRFVWRWTDERSASDGE